MPVEKLCFPGFQIVNGHEVFRYKFFNKQENLEELII